MTDNVCPICYENIGIENCTTTQCNHRFHCNCLIEHAYNHINGVLQCPVCRQAGLRIHNTVTGLTGVDASGAYHGATGMVDASGAYGRYYGPAGSYGNTYVSPYTSSASLVLSSISSLILSQTALSADSSELVNIRVSVEPSGNTIANITRLRQTGDYGVSRMTDAFATSVRNPH